MPKVSDIEKVSGKVTVKDRTVSINKKAAGIVNHINNCKVINQDPTWKGTLIKLTSALDKLAEIADNIKSVEDIHYPNYIGILVEGERMVKDANEYVENTYKKTIFKNNAKRKKEIDWVSNLVIYYASLLSYITDPKELPKIDLDVLFGEDSDALNFAQSVWGGKDGGPVTPLVPSGKFFEEYEKIKKKYPLKHGSDGNGFVRVDMVSPVFFASILGPYAELKNLKSYDYPVYQYNEDEIEKPRVREYKKEDDSKYFYILTKKFEGEKINGKEIASDLCLTPESDEVGSKVFLKTLTGTYDQQWTWGVGNDGSMSIINRKTLLAIDVNGCKPPEDRSVAPLVMQEPDGYESQNWLIAPDGHIFYHSPGNEKGYAMDLDGKEGVVGTCACVYRLLPKESKYYINQIWEIVPVFSWIKNK